MPKVSVIMPSYNHEKYVSEAVQSVLDQTFQDFEIIITDDGSTDKTVAEIKKFNDPRIRLFTFESNRGAGFASRNCVANAKGEYLAMLSSDDAFLPEKLEKQARFLDGHPEVWAVFTYAQIIDEEGKDFTDTEHFYYNIFNQPNRTSFEWLNHFFYKGNCLCHPSVLARRDVYTALGPPDPRYAQLGDFYRWIRTCLKHEIHIIPEKLVNFRVRSGESNASGARPETIKRTNFELSRIFRYYLEIDSAEYFLKIFPEAERYGKVEKDVIPYFLSRIAIDSKSFFPMLQYFGMSLLFDILGDAAMAERLEKKYGFRIGEFIKLTGTYDFSSQIGKDTHITNLETAIKDKDVHMGNLETIIKDKDVHIGNLETIIKDKDVHIGNLETHLKNLEVNLKDKDAYISNFEAALKDKDVHIGNLETIIKDKDVHIGNLEAIIKDKDVHMGNLETIIKDKDVHIGNLEAYVKDRDTALNKIYNSRGWKLLQIYYKLKGKILFSKAQE